MKKTFLVTAILLFLGIGLANSEEGDANWCLTLRDFTKPNLVTARAIVSFYREPWSEWLRNFIANRFKGTEANDLRVVYKATSANLVFVDNHFKPKASMKAVMKEFSGNIPNEEELKRLLQELEEARQSVGQTHRSAPTFFISGVDPDAVMVCPSREPDKNFFISGVPLEKDQENAVIHWAKLQKKAYERLAEKGLEVDSTFTASFISLLKSKTPYPGFSWISFADNETAIVGFLKSDILQHLQAYKVLKDAVSKYEDLAKSSQIIVCRGRPMCLPAEKLKPGSHEQAVTTVQKRLIQEGYMEGTATGVLDEKTRTALMDFQRIHFVTPDGTVGPKTVEKMNIPYEEKLKWIRVTLEGIEEAPFRLYNQFIWVNIPTFSLEYYADGKLISRHKVIVGRSDGKEIKIRGKIVRWNNTLPLVSEIKSVVINPRWYVPDRIRVELKEKAGDDEFFFQKQGFVMLESARLYQLPGGKNPLGKVKFLFDNPYGFFLHDTPEQHLFKRASRTISHGCVRVEKALDLAKEILERDNPKKAAQIDTYLKKSDQTYITLEHPIPIVITYFPVSVSEEGLLEFGGDPYGWADQIGFKGFFYVKDAS
jgi:hypothetical protein